MLCGMNFSHSLTDGKIQPVGFCRILHLPDEDSRVELQLVQVHDVISQNVLCVASIDLTFLHQIKVLFESTEHKN